MFKINYIKTIFTFVLIAVSFIAQSQTIDWTLEKAITQAIKNRKTLSKAKSEIIISQMKTSELNAKYLPLVSAEYSYRYNIIVPTNVMPASVFDPSTAEKNIAFKMGADFTQRAGISVEQPVFNANFSRLISEAKLGEELARLNNREAEMTIAYETAKAYLNIVVTEQQLQQSLTDTTRTYVTLQIMQQKFNNQRVLKSDVNEAIIAHNNNIQIFKNNGSNLLVQKQFLLYLTGNGFDQVNIMNVVPYLFTENMSSVDDGTLHQLPQIALLDTNNKLLDAKKSSERAKHLPVFGVVGFLGSDQYADKMNPFQSGTWFGNSYIGINLKIPIFFGENTAKRIGQFKEQQKQNNFQIEENINKVKYDAAAALEHYRNTQSKIETLEVNINLTKESLTIFTERFVSDQLSAYDLNTKELVLQKMKAELTQLQNEKVLFWLDWMKANGGIKQFIER